MNLGSIGIDTATIIGLIMVFSAFMSVRMGRRSQGTWRSAYGVLLLAIVHIMFLYKFFGDRLGRFGSEEWAAVTAAAIAGIAADDDADAVGLLLVILGIVQVAILAGVLSLRATTPGIP